MIVELFWISEWQLIAVIRAIVLKKLLDLWRVLDFKLMQIVGVNFTLRCGCIGCTALRRK